MTHRMLIVFLMLLGLTACGEPSPTPAGSEGGERVAPTEAAPGEMESCALPSPEDGRPVTADEAEELAIDSVGGELDEVETVADNRQVCDQTYDVWVVTGTLPNGDHTETYVTRDTGHAIHVSISGTAD